MSDEEGTTPEPAPPPGAPDTLDAELQQILQQAAPPPRKPRYVCAGSRRVDEDTGSKQCTFQSYYKWYGYCPGCHRPLACIHIPKKAVKATPPVLLNKATMDKIEAPTYYSTGIPELDRVLGGGFVLGTTLLLGSARGSGKTTMLLQACNGFAVENRKAYFASGEMTQDKCLWYANRLGIRNKNIRLFNDPSGLEVEALFDDAEAFGAKLLIIDSLQVTLCNDVKGDIGNTSMLDAVINMVSSWAQLKNVACVIIGHIGKGGDYLGSAKVQFLVDGLIRMTIKHAGFDDDGEPIDSMVRQISMDGKSRQGRSDIKSLVELTPEGIKPVSARASRLLSRLHLVER